MICHSCDFNTSRRHINRETPQEFMPGVVSRIISLIKSGKQHVTAVNKSDDLVKGKDQKLGT